MAKVTVKLSAQSIRTAVKQRVEGPVIALTKNPDVMRLLGEKLLKL